MTTQQKKIGTLKSLRTRWSGCDLCPLHCLRRNVVMGMGNVDAKIAVIGDAPRDREDVTGLPFAGAAYEHLETLLNNVGIDIRSLWLTNVVACRPKKLNGQGNRRINLSEMNECLSRLSSEINIVKPEIIVLAGNAPLQLATGKSGITKNRGWVENCSWTGNDFTVNKIYATLHPSSIEHGPDGQKEQKFNWMLSDWQEIARILHGEATTTEN